jgi:hypothetical protein
MRERTRDIISLILFVLLTLYFLAFIIGVALTGRV